MSQRRQLAFVHIELLVLGLALALIASSAHAQSSIYLRTNLVSDIAGANFTDSNLVNSWGIVGAGGTGPFWIVDNGTGVSTLCNGDGVAFPTNSPLVVTIPTPPNNRSGAVAAPTGVVFNDTGSREKLVREKATSVSGCYTSPQPKEDCACDSQ